MKNNSKETDIQSIESQNSRADQIVHLKSGSTLVVHCDQAGRENKVKARLMTIHARLSEVTGNFDSLFALNHTEALAFLIVSERELYEVLQFIEQTS